MINIKKFLASFAVGVFGLIGFAALVGPTVSAQFDPLEKTCAQPGAADSTICKEKAATAGEDPLAGEDSTLMKITNLLSLATSVIAVIVIIVAGFTMTLSSGDTAKISSSRNAIIYAAVGLIVVALSRAIIIFVINRA